jgi:hypothetical protein
MAWGREMERAQTTAGEPVKASATEATERGPTKVAGLETERELRTAWGPTMVQEPMTATAARPTMVRLVLPTTAAPAERR